jgi:hypothetical protein
MNKYLLLLVFLFAGGCVQGSYLDGSTGTVAPTVVFEPSGSSSLLSCVNELQGLTRKEVLNFTREVAENIDPGNEENQLKYICLSLNPKADYKQFKRGKKALAQYIEQHPDATSDMQGLLVLVKQLDRALLGSFSGRNKIQAERDMLAAKIEALELETTQDQVKIQELQRQVDQLKNIENIIKNREHTK